MTNLFLFFSYVVSKLFAITYVARFYRVKMFFSCFLLLMVLLIPDNKSLAITNRLKQTVIWVKYNVSAVTLNGYPLGWITYLAVRCMLWKYLTKAFKLCKQNLPKDQSRAFFKRSWNVCLRDMHPIKTKIWKPETSCRAMKRKENREKIFPVLIVMWSFQFYRFFRVGVFKL